MSCVHAWSAAFDRFIALSDRSDEQIAALARSLEIDIAVDLGGYTQHARPRIFALRAAPIQVSYLGFLGTMGADFMDYLLADEILVPREQRRHYAERIAYLPSYQANDSRRPVSDRVFTRAELGLPASGFVFCCFNASYKITPETFASWMRILAAVPGSTLLLLADNAAARAQPATGGGRRAASIRPGSSSPAESLTAITSPDTAPRTSFSIPCPTTPARRPVMRSWAGLPVLTCAGESLAARMGASLLTAVGLPELIAYDRHGITSGSRSSSHGSPAGSRKSAPG